MKVAGESNEKFYGERNGEQYSIQDDLAAMFKERWKNSDAGTVVNQTLKDVAFWGEDLTLLNGFADSVNQKLKLIMQNGVKQTIQSVYLNKEIIA